MFGSGSVKKSEYKENVEKLTAHFQTSLGDFEIELFVKECPETVWNFVNLAEGRQETPAKTYFLVKCQSICLSNLSSTFSTSSCKSLSREATTP